MAYVCRMNSQLDCSYCCSTAIWSMVSEVMTFHVESREVLRNPGISMGTLYTSRIELNYTESSIQM